MIDSEYDALIVGGGLIGLLAAHSLCDAGITVAVVERGELGSEASWAGGGILSPLYPWRYPAPVLALARWSQAHYAALCDTLAEETGIDPQWTRSGLLVLDPGDWQEGATWAVRQGSEFHMLTGRELLGCEPALSESLVIDPGARAAWLPDVAQVRNPRLLKALKSSLRSRGVALYENTEVRDLRVVRGRVTGVTTATGKMGATRVIIAAGAWSGRLLENLGVSLSVSPVRGQMLLFHGRAGLLRRIVLHQDRYIIPRRDGRILAGSTLEQVGFDKATTADASLDLHRAALNLMPALANCPVEQQWAGLRPGTPTGVPYIGAHPTMEGLYVCAGHYRNGVVLGLASARLLADLVLDRSPIIDPNPYAIPIKI